MSRRIRRWVGHCLVDGCIWNEREPKVLHQTPEQAQREAREHAAADHIEAREVTVERTYVIAKEEVIRP